MDSFEFENLLLTERSRTAAYQSRKEEKKIDDWGQRKLLLSEIEFFSLYLVAKRVICIYIGAAPGDHIEFLSNMFTNIEFHLYDNPELYGSDFNVPEIPKRIKIFRQYFGDDDIPLYNGEVGDTEGGEEVRFGERNPSGKPIYLISDLRTSDYISLRKKFYTEQKIKVDEKFNPVDPLLTQKYGPMLDLQLEKEIWADMQRQEKWVLALNPQESLLKFRLPYPKKGFSLEGPDTLEEDPNKGTVATETVPYLDGKIYFQIWEGATSSELRLVPTRSVKTGEFKKKNYNLQKHDDQVFYHNTVTRLKKNYYNIFNGKDEHINEDELLNDYDSTAEAAILIMYLKKFDLEPSKDLVIKMSEKITDFLSSKDNRKGKNLQSLRPKKGLSALAKPGLKISSGPSGPSGPSGVVTPKEGGLKITKIGFSKPIESEPVEEKKKPVIPKRKINLK